MDSRTFDTLTKAMATGTSRRSVLRGLAGGLAAALGVAAGTGTVSAKTAEDKAAKQEQKAAEKAEKDAAKTCAGELDGVSCGVDAVCCGGSCRDTAFFQSDPSNCGTCGNACTNGLRTCEGGICQFPGAGPGPCTDPSVTCDQPCSRAINREDGLGCECFVGCGRGDCTACDASSNTCVSCDSLSQVCDDTGICIAA